MKNLITVTLSFYCTLTLSSPKEILLHCEKPNNTEKLISLSYNEKVFYVKNTERGCDSEYSYKKIPGKADGIITSFPSAEDLGLNAYNILYLVSQGANNAIYAGEVPESAIELENGTFENILQSGGSIYKNAYKLDDGKISILSPTKELIISDTQCIYEDAYSKHCKTMSGSFKKPLCILNYSNRKVKTDMTECIGMSNE